MLTMPKLPPLRAGRQPPPDVVKIRETMATAIAAATWRSEPHAQQETIAGVRSLRFSPGGPARGVVLHFHGGGFRIGAPEFVAGFAAKLAARCVVEVICPAYRLAPEHPFPAGLTDARAVLAAIRDKFRFGVILSGDSAGAGLATSLAALSVADPVPPMGLVVLSGWLDLTLTSPCYEQNAATDPLFSRTSAELAAELYLQGAAADDPLVSPLLGSVEGFPPTLVSFGTGEVLADDSRKLFEKLQSAGVETRLSAIDGMEHVAVTRSFELPGATETFAAIAEFVDDILTRSSR